MQPNSHLASIQSAITTAAGEYPQRPAPVGASGIRHLSVGTVVGDAVKVRSLFVQRLEKQPAIADSGIVFRASPA